jgi:lipase chaperone LimK
MVNRIIWLTIITAVVAVSLVVWLGPTFESDTATINQRAASLPMSEFVIEEVDIIPAIDGDGINSGVNALKTDEAWLNEGVHDLFAYFIGFYEQGEGQMWAQFNAYCQSKLYCPALRHLFSRYIDYKTQLQRFDADVISSADDFYRRQEGINHLRNALFSAEEIASLFLANDEWDNYAIERLAIRQDTTLSEQAKSALIVEQLQRLPEALHQAIAPTLQLQKASSLLQSHANYNDFAGQFGAEAAERLIALQQEDAQWAERVEDFKRALAEMPEHNKEGRQQLRSTLFNANEQKRLAVLLPGED